MLDRDIVELCLDELKYIRKATESCLKELKRANETKSFRSDLEREAGITNK